MTMHLLSIGIVPATVGKTSDTCGAHAYLNALFSTTTTQTLHLPYLVVVLM